MAHEYSVLVHDWISGKIDRVKPEIKKARDLNDISSEQYFNGQLQELLNIRQYLTDQIDLDTHKYYS